VNAVRVVHSDASVATGRISMDFRITASIADRALAYHGSLDAQISEARAPISRSSSAMRSQALADGLGRAFGQRDRWLRSDRAQRPDLVGKSSLASATEAQVEPRAGRLARQPAGAVGLAREVEGLVRVAAEATRSLAQESARRRVRRRLRA